jgi:hypothetical protein
MIETETKKRLKKDPAVCAQLRLGIFGAGKKDGEEEGIVEGLWTLS